MNLNCDRCGIEMEWDGEKKTDYTGIECTVEQYIDLTKDNPNVLHVCEKCLDQLPDASKYFESGKVMRRPLPEKNN